MTPGDVGGIGLLNAQFKKRVPAGLSYQTSCNFFRIFPVFLLECFDLVVPGKVTF